MLQRYRRTRTRTGCFRGSPSGPKEKIGRGQPSDNRQLWGENEVDQSFKFAQSRFGKPGHLPSATWMSWRSRANLSINRPALVNSKAISQLLLVTEQRILVPGTPSCAGSRMELLTIVFSGWSRRCIEEALLSDSSNPSENNMPDDQRMVQGMQVYLLNGETYLVSSISF
jgi:hypothetical protein